MERKHGKSTPCYIKNCVYSFLYYSMVNRHTNVFVKNWSKIMSFEFVSIRHSNNLGVIATVPPLTTPTSLAPVSLRWWYHTTTHSFLPSVSCALCWNRIAVSDCRSGPTLDILKQNVKDFVCSELVAAEESPSLVTHVRVPGQSLHSLPLQDNERKTQWCL